MREIALLSAVDQRWGIGYKNQLLFHIKKDLEMFQKKTSHQIVVMGRKTLESLPGGNPLPNRRNIVLSRNARRQNQYEGRGDNLCFFHSVGEVLDFLEREGKNVFIIGGETIYEQFLPFASVAYITKIDAWRRADRFFPNLDQNCEWRQIDASEKQRDQSGVEYQFVKYMRVGMCGDIMEGCP